MLLPLYRCTSRTDPPAHTALTQPVEGLGAILADELETTGVSLTRRFHRSPDPDVGPFQPPGFGPGPMDRTPSDSWTIRLKPPPGRTLSVRCGPVLCFLPTHARHDDYLDFFFTQINPFLPCLNENGVRQRSSAIYERAFGPSAAEREPALRFTLGPYLALLFNLYACVDIFKRTPGAEGQEAEGYAWFRQAQELIGRRQIPAAGGDLTGIQIVILQVGSTGLSDV